MPSKKSIRKQQRKAYLDTIPTTTLQALIDRGEFPADYMFMTESELSDWTMEQIRKGRKAPDKYDYEVREL